MKLREEIRTTTGDSCSRCILVFSLQASNVLYGFLTIIRNCLCHFESSRNVDCKTSGLPQEPGDMSSNLNACVNWNHSTLFPLERAETSQTFCQQVVERQWNVLTGISQLCGPSRLFFHASIMQHNLTPGSFPEPVRLLCSTLFYFFFRGQFLFLYLYVPWLGLMEEKSSIYLSAVIMFSVLVFGFIIQPHGGCAADTVSFQFGIYNCLVKETRNWQHI